MLASLGLGPIKMGLLDHETTYHCGIYEISHIGCVCALQIQNFKSKRFMLILVNYKKIELPRSGL